MTYPWAAGEVLLAADLNSTFAAKSDYAPTQNTQTGVGASAYTFVLADATRMTVANAATAATYTIPPAASVAWVSNTVINVTSIGAGTITFAGGAGVTVTNTAGTLSQYQAAMLVRTASDAWTVVPFAGGASLLKSSDVSATTGSPTITTSGGKTIYQFTGSGTIVLNKAGLCSVVVIGGGGAGGRGFYGSGGGGGAGGYLELTDTAYLLSGTVTVTIGSGGSGVSARDEFAAPGVTTRLGSLYGVGGGVGAPGLQGTGTYGTGMTGGSGGGGGASNAGPVFNGVGGAGVGGIGFAGGNGLTNAGGGGGGGSAVGVTAPSGTVGGDGGAGQASSITGSSVTRAGGGGGGAPTTGGVGGAGGGGAGSANATATNGTANLGGGGGGAGSSGASTYNGGNGGSGVVIISVKT